jgi:hypothetical protein
VTACGLTPQAPGRKREASAKPSCEHPQVDRVILEGEAFMTPQKTITLADDVFERVRERAET